MIGSFSFNGVEAESFGLVCKSVKRPLLPASKATRNERVGASGIYDFNEDEYSYRSITMKVSYIGADYYELRSKARQIAAWLSTKTWVRLIIHDEDDKYYLAKVTSEIDLTNLWESGSADISFDCQPFAYSIAEITTTLTGVGPHVFTYGGTRAINFKSPYGSKFRLSVTGTWITLTIALNSEQLAVGAVSVGTGLVIDSVDMTATINGVNVFNQLSLDIGKFLELLPGNNTLTVTGTALSNIEIGIDYIPLWI